MKLAQTFLLIGVLIITGAVVPGPWHTELHTRWTQLKLMEFGAFLFIVGIAFAVYSVF